MGTGEPLPGASSKVEGSLDSSTTVSTQQGNMTLERNRFFDKTVFDPGDIPEYLSKLP
jgi:NitT/TauT family transport system ATP-binding protein